MRGLSPPCTQKMHYPTTTAMGRKLRVSQVGSAFALIEKAIHFVEFAGLVVAPQQEEGAGVAYFVGEEEDALQGLLAPVDVVSQEEVVFASRK